MGSRSEPISTSRTAPDAISCVGLLLLLLFIGGGVRSVVSGLWLTEDVPATVIAVLPTAEGLAQVAPTEQALDSAVPDLVAAAATQPPAPTATALLAPTVTLEPTAPPLVPDTPTPIPTETPAPTLTPTVYLSATPVPIEQDAIAQIATERAPVPTPPVPLPTPIEGVNEARVPILMYHYVSEPPVGADIYRVDLSVRPNALREQLLFLRDNGYTTIDLYDLTRALAGHTQLPAKPVILTFDDGYRDNYYNAFNLLVEFGMKGTFFIITDYADTEAEAHMTWPMIEEMAQAGMSMESHTLNHPNLESLSWDDIVEQMRGSRDALAAHIGTTPRFLAYPAGRYNQDSIDVLYELGYWGAVTTNHGSFHQYHQRYELKRIRMRNTTTLWDFAAQLNSAE